MWPLARCWTPAACCSTTSPSLYVMRALTSTPSSSGLWPGGADTLSVMESAREVEFVFEPQDEGGYHVYAPELPGLHTQGNSLDEALDLGKRIQPPRSSSLDEWSIAGGRGAGEPHRDEADHQTERKAGSRMRSHARMSAGSRDRVSRCLALGLLALSMLACTAALLPAHASARGTCPNENSTFTSGAPALRASVLCLVNVTRLGRGLPALQRNFRLENAAQLHTDDMVARGYFDHVSPPPNSTTYDQRIRAAGYLFDAAVESLATGSSTPRLVVDLWLVDKGVTPPGHCRNILDPGMRDLGVGINSGVAVAPFVGVWTKEFGRLQNIPAASTNLAPYNACPDALSPIVAVA